MKQLSNEDEKRALSEYMWLSYFNHTLRDKGLISQKQYQALQSQFLSRTVSPKTKTRTQEMEM